MGQNEICVPSSALEMPGEEVGGDGGGGGAGVSPAVGDEVEFSVKGKVSRIEGGNSYVTPSEANGQPIAGAGAKASDPGEPDSDDSMDAAVAGARAGRDEGMGY